MKFIGRIFHIFSFSQMYINYIYSVCLCFSKTTNITQNEFKMSIHFFDFIV